MYTENISRNGLLVAWRGQDGAPPLPGFGQIVTIEIELPVSHGFGQKCIHCQGTVTRISDGGTRTSAGGSACQLHGFPLVSRPDSRDGGGPADGELLDGVI